MASRSAEGLSRIRIFQPGVIILVCAVSLTVFGVSVLFSASAHSGSDPYFFIRRQFMWLGIALLVGFFLSLVNLDGLKRFAWPALAVSLAGLVLVLIPGIGVEVNGARRWIDLGFMRVQVSEFAKLGLVFTLACYFGANQRAIPSFWAGFVLPCAYIGLFAGLIFLEPDYGTAALCGAVGLTLLFLAGVRLTYLVPMCMAATAAFALAVFTNPLRRGRILSFMDIEGNRGDGAYQLWQAILAFGTGGTQGVGLGNGRQQMAFLPEAHTDFIFAVIGEELGFFATTVVLLLFLVLFLAGIWHLRRAPNMYQYLLVAGALLLLSVQALINMAVVTGCLPTKGLSLPFISYGGSNLVAMFAIIGVLVNTSLSWTKSPIRHSRRRLKEIAA